jgi:hypothetical protein
MAIAPVSKKQIIVNRATGTHFYKYSAFTGERREWLKDLIQNHRFYAPTVKQLRDPSDGRPKLAPQTPDEMFSFLYNSQFGVLGRNPGMSVEEQIKHGIILDVNIRKHGVEQLMPVLEKTVRKEFEDFRIYSLTKRFNNLSLWENYAANHSGYCLEFANDGVFRLANDVNYEDVPEFGLLDDDQRSGWFLFYKRVDYRSEEEVRMHVPRMFSGGLVPFDPKHLTRLILGKHMPEADRALIREWAKQRTPELKIVTAFWDSDAQDIRILD